MLQREPNCRAQRIVAIGKLERIGRFSLDHPRGVEQLNCLSNYVLEFLLAVSTFYNVAVLLAESLRYFPDDV